MEKGIADAVFRELSGGWDTPLHNAGEILLRGGRLAWNDKWGDECLVHGNMYEYQSKCTEADLADFVIRCREQGVIIHNSFDKYGGLGWVLDESQVCPYDHTRMTIDEFTEFVERHSWQEAVTATHYAPHKYVVKGRLTAGEGLEFERAVLFIREKGFPAWWFSEKRMYYRLDQHYYWTIGAPMIVTIILNRARCDEYDLVDNKWIWKN